MKSHQDKVAFITGAASGIGRALATTCLEHGMAVVAADRDASALARLAAEHPSTEHCLLTLHCDVTADGALAEAALRAEDAFGPVNLLINNAGAFANGGVGDLTLPQWRRLLEINLLATVAGVEAFLPQLERTTGAAHILNLASVAGHAGFAGLAAYCSSKHAVVGYSEALHHELRPKAIGVSVLCPGFVNTSILDNQLTPKGSGDDTLREAVAAGMSPQAVAAHALAEVWANPLFIFSHPGTEQEVTERQPHIQSAFLAAGESPTIGNDPDAHRQASREVTQSLHHSSDPGDISHPGLQGNSTPNLGDH